MENANWSFCSSSAPAASLANPTRNSMKDTVPLLSWQCSTHIQVKLEALTPRRNSHVIAFSGA
eukprot:3049767-Amphidinium_carterae.2